MILTFLGTSAANAFPEAFCKCAHCEQARSLGGPSLRKRASLLVNDDLLIDLGPDIMAACQVHGCSLSNVSLCLQTHPHADHLDLSHLLSRSPGYGGAGAPCLHFYASEETLQRSAQTFRRDLADGDLLSPEMQASLNLRIHTVEPLRPFECGGYRVTAFPANHAPGTGASLYAVESGDQHAVFYGSDTASLFEDTWEAFHRYRLTFDAVILDHTYGPEQAESDHLSARQVIQHAQRLREEGLLTRGGRVFGTHIAHEGNPPHPMLADYAGQNGYEIAHDVLRVNVG
jgi:phosphoribosyl 1,2-cyclic phosphate phosphodiesterase